MPSAPARSAALTRLDGHRRAIAGRGDDREFGGVSLTAAATTSSTSARVQGEELTGATGREQPGGVVPDEPTDVLAVRRLVERQVGGEVRDREREEAGAETLGDLKGREGGHGARVSSGMTLVDRRGVSQGR